MTNVAKYTLDDFDKIIFDGFEYVLPNNILNIVSELAEEVGAPSYIKTPIFEKKEKKKKNLKILDEEWESIRQFKVTNINNITMSIFSNLRVILNKFSDDNYDVNFNELNKELGKIMETAENQNDNFKSAVNIMFDIISSNSFYSKLYARLFCDLIKIYPIFLNLLDDSFKDFSSKFDNIKNNSLHENYSDFCDNNSENQKRNSLTLFYVNLMKYELISEYDILRLVDILQDLLYKYIDHENMVNTLEEITDNLFIIIKHASDELKESAAVTNITNRIEIIANYKANEHDSLSNKTIFKHMDMLDILE